MRSSQLAHEAADRVACGGRNEVELTSLDRQPDNGRFCDVHKWPVFNRPPRHNCAAELGYLRQPPTDGLLGSTYQLAKYIKHTVPDPKFAIQSVFASASTDAYAAYIVESMAAGSLEIDAYARKNIIWTAGEKTGFLFRHGRLMQPQDAVKVVLSSSTGEIHAFPANSTIFAGATCSRCGAAIVV